MFDPAAFENMKVVMEGGFYDRDLRGEIRIMDRNDIMNSAKLSRRYDLSFTDSFEGHADIWCTFIMEAALENLAAELLPSAQSEKLAGCHVMIKFTLTHKNDFALFQKIREILKDIWGKERTIKQTGKFNPEEENGIAESESAIYFNRLVYEEQIDDLGQMIDYMIASLKALRSANLK